MGSPNSSPRCERAELIGLLGRTLGDTVAADVVERTEAELGFDGPILPREAAYEVLDTLAASPGVIGTAAASRGRSSASPWSGAPWSSGVSSS